MMEWVEIIGGYTPIKNKINNNKWRENNKKK